MTPIPVGPIEVVGLDGDDTLWRNEEYFADTQEFFRALVAPYVNGTDVDAVLAANERRNLELFGFGVKGFTLSMIETAIEVSHGRVGSHEVEALLDRGKAMLAQPVELLDGVADTVAELAGCYRLVLITKGDLLHQEQKLARSGLAELFSHIEAAGWPSCSPTSRSSARRTSRPTSASSSATPSSGGAS
jgi:putative hydrolase of the HAD superfamily